MPTGSRYLSCVGNKQVVPTGSRYLACVGNKQAVPREGGILKLQEQYFRVFAVSFVLITG